MQTEELNTELSTEALSFFISPYCVQHLKFGFIGFKF